jgi:hypothetical protein
MLPLDIGILSFHLFNIFTVSFSSVTYVYYMQFLLVSVIGPGAV